MARQTSYIHLAENDEFEIVSQGPHESRPEAYPVIQIFNCAYIYPTEAQLINLQMAITEYFSHKAVSNA